MLSIAARYQKPGVQVSAGQKDDDWHGGAVFWYGKANPNAGNVRVALHRSPAFVVAGQSCTGFDSIDA
jgi:hypothetical protein